MDKKEFNCNDDSEVLFLGVGDGEIEIADDTKLKTRSEKFPIPKTPLNSGERPKGVKYIPDPNQPVELGDPDEIDEPNEPKDIPKSAFSNRIYNPTLEPDFKDPTLEAPKPDNTNTPKPGLAALQDMIEAVQRTIERKKAELETALPLFHYSITKEIEALEERLKSLQEARDKLYAQPKDSAKPKTIIAPKPETKNDVAREQEQKPEKPKRDLIPERRVPNKSTRTVGIITESERKALNFHGRMKPLNSANRTPASKRLSADGVFRFIAPEVAAAYGKKPEEGVILDPSLVAVFKGAIEEEGKTGFAVMDTFARVYGRKLLMATANPEGHQKFLNDPVLWSQATIDSLIRLARAASAGNADALAMLESAYTGVRPQVIKNLNSGRVEAHPKLRRFAEFSKKWLRSVFGKNANIYFLEDLKNSTDPELAEAYREFQAKGNKINAFINMDTGNVFVRKGANPIKVFHEVFGHATWHWLKNNDRKGYEKLRELAENAPQKLKDKIARVYGTPDPALKGTKEYEEQMDYYLDEVFAHLMELKYSGRVESFLLKESVARERCSRNAFHKSNRDVRKKASCYAGELLKTLASLFFDWKGCQTTGV